MSNLTFLATWCESYYERTGIRTQPHTLPVADFANDMLYCLQVMRRDMELMFERIIELETALDEHKAQTKTKGKNNG